MRLLPLSILLAAAACSFNPGGDGASPDAPTDAREIDACAVGAETCDGTDQDCDGLIDEGFTIGGACDGPDADSCTDDMSICNAAGSEICGDTSGDDDAELCNTTDDDCDGMTDEGFGVGSDCDGEDGDACLEGTLSCTVDGLVCGDNTGTIVEICDGNDEDCDGTADDGFDLATDTANCGECNNACTNSRGSTSCMGSMCRPLCTNGAANCDGDPDNGCELQDTNPTCSNSAAIEHTVDGDAADTETVTGTTEKMVRVRLRESIGANGPDVTGRFALTSGAGANYTLVVHCAECGDALTDASNVVSIGRTDVNFEDGTMDVTAEIRYNSAMPSTTCAPWTLVITGNVTTGNRCGD